MRLNLFKVIGLMSLLSSPAVATTYEFVSEDNLAIPVLWNYREMATRTVIGCRQWDVLQGTGWFQATWHTEYTPEADGNVYRVTPTPKLAAKLCAAKMDQYNRMRVEAGALRGSFSVIPDGFASEASIICRPRPEGTEYDNLVCEDAHVSVPERGTVRVIIHYQE
jgi:hypothetical protein